MDDLVRFGKPRLLPNGSLARVRAGNGFSQARGSPRRTCCWKEIPSQKKLGWGWGGLVNSAICFGMAFWPATAIAVSTMSVLVAARNFQSAWLMRSMGEENYRDWHVRRIQETPHHSLLILPGRKHAAYRRRGHRRRFLPA